MGNHPFGGDHGTQGETVARKRTVFDGDGIDWRLQLTICVPGTSPWRWCSITIVVSSPPVSVQPFMWLLLAIMPSASVMAVPDGWSSLWIWCISFIDTPYWGNPSIIPARNALTRMNRFTPMLKFELQKRVASISATIFPPAAFLLSIRWCPTLQGCLFPAHRRNCRLQQRAL